MALLWLTLIVGRVFPQYVLHYVILMVFLGVFLRPLLEVSKAYDFYQYVSVEVGDRLWKKTTEKKRRKIECEERIKALKSRRYMGD